MNQLSLLPETPIKPWPEEIVERLNGQMSTIEHSQGRLYCVGDWVKGGKTSSACVVRRVGHENYVPTSIRAIIVDLIAAATNVHFTSK
jgi:hypothetical protein